MDGPCSVVVAHCSPWELGALHGHTGGGGGGERANGSGMDTTGPIADNTSSHAAPRRIARRLPERGGGGGPLHHMAPPPQMSLIGGRREDACRPAHRVCGPGERFVLGAYLRVLGGDRCALGLAWAVVRRMDGCGRRRAVAGGRRAMTTVPAPGPPARVRDRRAMTTVPPWRSPAGGAAGTEHADGPHRGMWRRVSVSPAWQPSALRCAAAVGPISAHAHALHSRCRRLITRRGRASERAGERASERALQGQAGPDSAARGARSRLFLDGPCAARGLAAPKRPCAVRARGQQGSASCYSLTGWREQVGEGGAAAHMGSAGPAGSGRREQEREADGHEAAPPLKRP